ncbi:MAG: hypothetical protein ACWGQW_19730 [bacterium]
MDHPVCRKDWARDLDAIEKTDSQVGEILERLQEEGKGIAENTLVIFIGDNGRCHLRGKYGVHDLGMDHIRSIRTRRFKHIRIYNPENEYHECEYAQRNRPMLAVINELHAKGKLTEVRQLILKGTKPNEELYDLQADPHDTGLASLNQFSHSRPGRRWHWLLDRRGF